MALKREDVIRVTKELVAEYGEDYVYERGHEVTCKYGPTELADGCIVGLIAKRLDTTLYQRLIQYERDSSISGSYVTPWGAIDGEEFEGIIQAEDEDLKLLYAMQDAQARQDAEHPWGQAVEPILELED